MKLAGVEARQRRKFKATTNSKHNLPVAPNLLDRRFESEGWLYLAVVIDLFSRRVVGWAMNKRMTRQLVMDALLMAIWRIKPSAGLIFHSDRGSQYCSHDFQRLLTRYGMRSSMSRKGDCWDNAVAESFFGTLKTEQVFGVTYATRDHARRELIDYIEMFYNSNRRHSYLNYMSPMECERQWLLKKAA